MSPWRVWVFIFTCVALAASPLDTGAALAAAGAVYLAVIAPVFAHERKCRRTVRVTDPHGHVAQALGVPVPPPGYQVEVEIMATRSQARETRRDLESLARGEQ